MEVFFMTDLEVLNEVLISFANVKKVGIRRKIVLLERYLKSLKKKISKPQRLDIL